VIPKKKQAAAVSGERAEDRWGMISVIEAGDVPFQK
jgi:hypothetical protein